MGITGKPPMYLCSFILIYVFRNGTGPVTRLESESNPQPMAYCDGLYRQKGLELAADVLLQSSQHLALFRESIELLLYSAVESDYRKECHPPILPLVLNLLRTGKSTIVIPTQAFASNVVSCARKLETSRWDTLFNLVGSPEQFFNDCIYHGNLRTAASFCLVADHYNPESAEQRIAVLRKSAETYNDLKLLKEIEHYAKNKSVDTLSNLALVFRRVWY